jgi:hypothetical protein
MIKLPHVEIDCRMRSLKDAVADLVARVERLEEFTHQQRPPDEPLQDRRVEKRPHRAAVERQDGDGDDKRDPAEPPGEAGTVVHESRGTGQYSLPSRNPNGARKGGVAVRQPPKLSPPEHFRSPPC